MWSDEFVAFDTETTGLDSSARIVELACVTFAGGQVVREWTQLLRPEGVDWNDANVKKAMEVNRIELAALRDQPTFEQALANILLELAHPVLVAHNASFDVRMVNQELKRLGRPAIAPPFLVCTRNLASHLRGGVAGNRLSDVACRYNVLQEGAHRAAADAITCGRVLLRMRERGDVPQEDLEMQQLVQRASSWSGRR